MTATTARPLVATRLPPGPDVLAALRRAFDGGPALLPLPVDLPPRALDRLLGDLRPATLVDHDGSTDLPGARGVDPDVAVVIATSGSTGAPRGVELTRRALEASARAGLARLGTRPGERWLCCLPASSAGGLQVLTRSIVLGTDPVFVPRFSPDALAAASAAAHVALVPTMLRRLVDAGVDLGRLPHILLGGAPAPPPLLARARAAGARITVSYGMTETAGGCVYDGRPLDGVEIAIEGEPGEGGRIRIRGPILCRGYRTAHGSRPAAAPDGWLRTADMGRIDRTGRLEVLGRSDEVVISGGVNVVPAKVAALLTEHPAVTEAEVFGRPDPEWGHCLVAAIVPAAGAAAPDLQTLRAFLAERAGPAELPRHLLVLDRLPLLHTGKVDRMALRAHLPA